MANNEADPTVRDIRDPEKEEAAPAPEDPQPATAPTSPIFQMRQDEWGGVYD